MSDWREFGEQEWDKIRGYAEGLLHNRESVGRRDYGSGLLGGQFRGDPIQHLEDEISDALAYAYFTRKQRRELELEKERLERGIAERDSLLREGRFLAYVSCHAPGQSVIVRMRDWGKRVGDLIEPPSLECKTCGKWYYTLTASGKCVGCYSEGKFR